MSRHHLARAIGRVGSVGAAALATTLVMAGTAFAHAEVTADKPQALAEDVTLRFFSEAESVSAGFTELRIVLPEGIAPGDVTLADGPKGWKLTATADGYTIGGPALKPGVDAEHEVRVRQLPDAKEIAFKTVETYSDGEVSRWIEVSEGGDDSSGGGHRSESQQPAPVLKLKAAAPGASPVSPTPAASPSPSTPTPAAPSAGQEAAGEEKAAEEEGGSSQAPLIIGVAGAVLVLGAGGWWVARRRRTTAG